MKNYELIAELMKLPAGYDVKFGTTVLKEDFNGEECIFAEGTIEDIEVGETNKIIEFLC